MGDKRRTLRRGQPDCAGDISLWMTHVLSECRVYKASFSKYGRAYQTMIYPKLMQEATCLSTEMWGRAWQWPGLSARSSSGRSDDAGGDSGETYFRKKLKKESNMQLIVI